MPARGRPPLPRGVLAFDSPDWRPPPVVVLDANVVAEALLPNEPEHAACAALFALLRTHQTTIVFSRLLEIELWEVLFNLALRERHPAGGCATSASTTAFARALPASLTTGASRGRHCWGRCAGRVLSCTR